MTRSDGSVIPQACIPYTSYKAMRPMSDISMTSTLLHLHCTRQKMGGSSTRIRSEPECRRDQPTGPRLHLSQ